MERRTFMTMAMASAAAMLTGALAQGRHHDRHDDRRHGRHRDRDEWHGRNQRHWRDRHGRWHNEHDRYWRPHYGRRRYIHHDHVYRMLRRHRYHRWVGEPYWFHGRYVIRSYNRFGRLVFVEIDPYTGDFIGEVMF